MISETRSQSEDGPSGPARLTPLCTRLQYESQFEQEAAGMKMP